MLPLTVSSLGLAGGVLSRSLNLTNACTWRANGRTPCFRRVMCDFGGVRNTSSLRKKEPTSGHSCSCAVGASSTRCQRRQTCPRNGYARSPGCGSKALLTARKGAKSCGKFGLLNQPQSSKVPALQKCVIGPPYGGAASHAWLLVPLCRGVAHPVKLVGLVAVVRSDLCELSEHLAREQNCSKLGQP